MSPEKDDHHAHHKKKKSSKGNKKQASYVSRAALQKTARMQIDNSLPKEEQLHMQLALPDLTETDKLMISLKFKNEQRVESRKEEREKLL